MFSQFISQNLSKKLALCLAIPSSVILAYFIWKQSKDFYEYDDNFQIECRQTIIEVKVPIDCVGAIIGQEGSTIKEIQKQTNTRINFKDKSNTENLTHRLLLIRGTIQDAQRAEMEIKRIILDTPLSITDEILVPSECVGTIIGKKGVTINYMNKSSGCKIVVAKGALPSDSESSNTKITLNGSTEQILMAKNMINEKVREQNQRRNAHTRRQVYVADFSDESFASEKPRVVEFHNSNETHECYVTSIATPNYFWVNIRDEWKNFSRIEKELKKFYEKHEENSTLLIEDDLKRGQIVVAKFKHVGWTRAEVTDIRVSDDLNNNNNNDDDCDIDLYSLDYGENQWLKRKDLRKLLSRFNESPAQAIPCSLHGIAIMDYSAWAEDKIRLFEDLTSHSSDWKVMLTTFIEYEYTSEGNIAIVKLVDPNDNTDISERLLEEGKSIDDHARTSEDDETFYSYDEIQKQDNLLITHSF